MASMSRHSFWRYVGAWHGEIDLERYGPINEYLTRQVAAVISLALDERFALPAQRP
jgi:hypothetical protein